MDTCEAAIHAGTDPQSFGVPYMLCTMILYLHPNLTEVHVSAVVLVRLTH